MDTVDQLDPAAVRAKWAEIAPLIERMMERVSMPDELPGGSGTSLARDDTDSDPYQVSHVVRPCLTGGHHLHAAETLFADQRVLHLAAASSLARGALENSAVAHRVLGPKRRRERVERALRWQHQNAEDQHTALAELGLLTLSRDVQRSRTDQVALRQGLDPTELRSGYRAADG